MRFLKTNLKNKNRGADYCVFYALLILIVFATPIFAQTREPDSIRVGGYATFLEARASYDDASEFYNATMKDLIVQTWSEDHFDYQVASGVDDNTLLSNLTEEQIACYESWLENKPAAPLMMEWGGKESDMTAADSQRESLQRNSTQSRDGLSMGITEPSNNLHDFQRDPQCLLTHYQKADALWIKVAKAWDDLTIAQQKSERKQAAYEQACERREEEDRLYRAKDLKKTWLGWASSKLGGAASGAANVPDPHAQTASSVARAVSMALGAANKVLAKKDLWYAQVLEKRAESKVTRSEKKLERIQETAPDLEYQAQLAEDEVAAKELEQSIRDAKRCQEKRPQDGKKIWQQRVKNSEVELQALERSEFSDNEKFNESKNIFEQALDNLSNLQEKLNDAQVRENALELEKRNLLLASEQACKDYTLAKAEYDQCHDKKIISAKREDKEQKKKAWIQFQADLKKCCDQREKQIQEIASQKEIVTKAEIIKKKAQQAHDDLEAQIMRSNERATRRLEADRSALRSIWPEGSDFQRTISAWKNLAEAQSKKEGYEQAREELKAVTGDVEGLIKREQNIAEKQQVLRQQETLLEIEKEIKKLIAQKKKYFLQQEEKISAQQAALDHEKDDLDARIQALQQDRESLQAYLHNEAEEVELKKDFVELRKRVINQDQEILIQKETDLAIEKEDLDQERECLAFQIDVLSKEKEALETKENELEENSRTNLPSLNKEQEKEERRLKERRVALQQALLEQAHHEIATLRERAEEYFVKAEKAKVEGEETEESYTWQDVGEGFNKAADNLEKATQAEVANNLEGAKIRRRSASAYLKSAELTERDKENESIQLYRKIGAVLGDDWSLSPANAYQKIIEQEKENPKAAAAWKEYIEARVAQVEMIEKQIEALSHHDEDAISVHEQAEEVRGNIAEAWKETAAAYERAFEEKAKGHFNVEEICLKAATVREQEAEALKNSDGNRAKLYGQIGEILKSDWGTSVIDAYQNIIDQEKENPKAAAVWKKYIEASMSQVEAIEKQINALSHDDQAAVLLHEKNAAMHEKVATAFKGAAEAYESAIEEKAKGHFNLEQAYLKLAEVSEKEAEALKRSDEKRAKLYGQIRGILKSSWDTDVINAYQKIIDQEKENPKAAATWKEYIKASMSQVEAIEKQIDALSHDDQAAVSLHEQAEKTHGKIAIAFQCSAQAYKLAIEEKASGNSNLEQAYLKTAEAYEKEAEALKRSDKKRAALYNQITRILKSDWSISVINVYQKIIDQKKENPKTAAAWEKYIETRMAQVEAIEKQIDALSHHNQAAVLLHEKNAGMHGEIATTFKRSAEAYESAIEEKAKGHFNVEQAYLKLAEAYEKEAAALKRSDEKGAALYSQIAGILKSSWERDVIDAYRKIIDQEKENPKTAAAWKEYIEARMLQIEAIEKQIEALSHYDQDVATVHEKNAAMRGNVAKAFKGAALAYEWAFEEKDNSNIGQVYLKTAEIREKEAAALKCSDEKRAELYGQIGEILRNPSERDVMDACRNIIEQEKENPKAAAAWKEYIEARMAQIETIEKQIEALSRHDEDGATVHEKNASMRGNIAIAFKGAAVAYENFVKKLNENDSTIAEIYEQAAEAYNQAAGSLQAEIKADDQNENRVARYQSKLALFQNNLGISFNNLVSYKQSNSAKRASSCQQCITAFKKAVENQQEAIKAFQVDRADLARYYDDLAGTYNSQGCAYHSVLIKEDEQAIADIYKKQTRAYGQQAEALEEQLKILSKDDHAITELDRETATIHGEVATAFKHSAEAYESAFKEKEKGCFNLEQAYLKLAEAHEKEAEALKDSDENRAKLYGQIREVLESSSSTDVIDACQKIINQEKENPKSAAVWKKYIEARMLQIEAIEKQIEALSHQDQAAVSLHEKVATAFQAAAEAYERAVEKKEKGNFNLEQAYLKLAEAHEKEAEALKRSDEKSAKLYGQIGRILKSGWGMNVINAYQKIIDQEKENPKAAAAWKRYIEASMSQVEAIEKQIETLSHQDQAAASLHEKVATAFKGAAEAYERAVEKKEKGNFNLEQAYLKLAEAHGKEAEALKRSDEKSAELYGEIKTIFRGAWLRGGGVAYAYQKVIDREKENPKAAAAWKEYIKARMAQVEVIEKQIDALSHQDQAAISLHEKSAATHEKVATAFEGAAVAYERAVEKKAKGDFNLEQVYLKTAEAREKEVEALKRSDEKSAELYGQIAGILKSSWERDVVDAYQKIVDQEKENPKATAAWKEYIKARMAQVEAIEKQIEALSHHDQDGATVHEKNAAMHGEVAKVFKSSAEAYENFVKKLNGNDSLIAEIDEQAAEAYNQAAESLQAAIKADDENEKKLAEYQRSLSLFQNNLGISFNQLVSYKQSNSAEHVASCQQYITAFKKAVENQQEAIKAFQVDRVDLASCYDNLASAYNNKSCAYDKGLEKKDEKAIANIYNKKAYAYEQQAEALEEQLKILSKEDHAITKLDRENAAKHEKIATAFKRSAEAYERAFEEKAKGHSNLEQAYLKLAEACEKEAEALKGSDENRAKLYGQMAGILKSSWDTDVIDAYQQIIDQEKENPKAAAAWKKYIEASMSQVEAIEQQIDALSHQDQTAVALHEKNAAMHADIAKAFLEVCEAYERALEEQANDNSHSEQIYLKIAEAHEKGAEALKQSHEDIATLYSLIGLTLRNGWSLTVTYAYQKISELEKENSKAAAAWKKHIAARMSQVEAIEKQIDALSHHDQDTARLHKQAVDSHIEIAAAFQQAAEAYEKGDEKAALGYEQKIQDDKAVQADIAQKIIELNKRKQLEAGLEEAVVAFQSVEAKEKQSGVLFKNAGKEKTESAWRVAQQSAQENKNLWEQIKHVCEVFLAEHATEILAEKQNHLSAELKQAKLQQEFWELKTTIASAEVHFLDVKAGTPEDFIAQGKAACAAAKAYWDLFSRAMKLFEQNPSSICFHELKEAASGVALSIDLISSRAAELTPIRNIYSQLKRFANASVDGSGRDVSSAHDRINTAGSALPTDSIWKEHAAWAIDEAEKAKDFFKTMIQFKKDNP